MITCITLNADGTEAFRETKPKRFVPRNGFERGRDGNFYKHLGNPLIISDIEKAEEIREKERIKLSNEEGKKLESQKGGFDPIMGSHIIHPIQKTTFKQLKNVTSWSYCVRSSCQATLAGVKFSVNILDLPEFDIFKTFRKVEINFTANLIKIWLNKAENEGPDYYIVKPLTNEDIQSYTVTS